MEEFENDVLQGLSSSPKQLSSKYFYDKVGDRLFQQIMALPEYYLTRAENEILSTQTKIITDALKVSDNHQFELIELGAGDGSKTLHLLRHLTAQNFDFNYLPIDISSNALQGLSTKLKSELPSLNVSPKQGTYFNVLDDLGKSKVPKIVLFLGSNIGNLLDDQAKAFVMQLSNSLQAGDKVLLGVDRIKSREIVLPAYNDSQGVTSAFNLNLLTRINRELNADFNLDAFVHVPEYSEDDGVARSFIQSTQDQEVTIGALGQKFVFEKGEKIHTEISRKYNREILTSILENSDFEIVEEFTDTEALFSDYLLVKNSD